MVFSKSYCPHCKAAKELLTEVLKDEKFTGIRMDVVELDKFEDSQAAGQIQAYLTHKTGQHTVPNIFIAGQHVGGNSELQADHKVGALEPWLLESLEEDDDDDSYEEEL